MNKIDVRIATRKDVKLVLEFIKALAEYERLAHEVIATELDFEKAMFGKNPIVKALLVYYEEVPVGVALYFYNFSTFVGKPGIYLEDLFVKPEYRGKGCGKALLIRLAQIAEEENCGRLEWAVLDWNKPSIEFYKSLGAKPMDEWTVYRLSGEHITKLANAKR